MLMLVLVLMVMVMLTLGSVTGATMVEMGLSQVDIFFILVQNINIKLGG